MYLLNAISKVVECFTNYRLSQVAADVKSKTNIKMSILVFLGITLDNKRFNGAYSIRSQKVTPPYRLLVELQLE